MITITLYIFDVIYMFKILSFSSIYMYTYVYH